MQLCQTKNIEFQWLSDGSLQRACYLAPRTGNTGQVDRFRRNPRLDVEAITVFNRVEYFVGRPNMVIVDRGASPLGCDVEPFGGFYARCFIFR
jgi:hypothetical protein